MLCSRTLYCLRPLLSKWNGAIAMRSILPSTQVHLLCTTTISGQHRSYCSAADPPKVEQTVLNEKPDGNSASHKEQMIQNMNVRDLLADIISKSKMDTTSEEQFRYDFQDKDRLKDVDCIVPIWNGNFSFWKGKGGFTRRNMKTVFVFGGSGVGKTRFSRELLPLLEKQAKDKDDDFSRHLKGGKNVTAHLSLYHNGEQIRADEWEHYKPSQILGLRLAAKYYFPNHNYGYIFRAVEKAGAVKWFDLDTVVDCISMLAPFGDKEQPESTPSVPTTLLIVVDEIQTVYITQVHHPKTSKPESLSLAFNRCLAETMAVRRKSMLVLGTFVGTATSSLMLPPPTEFATFSHALKPLSRSSAREIVRSFKNGEKWLSGRFFDRLLATTGYNPRILELFETILDQCSPEDPPYDGILSQLITSLQMSFCHPNPTAVSFACSLAIAGVPVAKGTVVYQSDKEKITIWDLQEAGILSLVGFPTLPFPKDKETEYAWANTWQKAKQYSIIDMPLALVLSFLTTAQQTLSPADGNLEFNNLSYNFAESAVNVDFTWSDFEELVVKHSAFRFSVASKLALMEKRHVRAVDLFLGSVCNAEFAELEFAPQENVKLISAKCNMWLRISDILNEKKELNTIVKFTNNRPPVDVLRENPFCIHLGGNNVFDGLMGGIKGENCRYLFCYNATQETSKYHDSLSPIKIQHTLDLGYLEDQISNHQNFTRRPELESNKVVPISILVTNHRLSSDAIKKVLSCKNMFVYSYHGLEWGLSPALARMVTFISIDAQKI